MSISAHFVVGNSGRATQVVRNALGGVRVSMRY